MQDLGALLVALLWISGLWGAVAAWEAARKPQWQASALGAWILHSLSALGTIGLLLYFLLAHRYEFHYAWAHGSRQLPTAYITAALWEGQEGSFLLWIAWHVVLGWGLWLVRDRHRWAILAGLLATNGYLATFLLGVSLPTLAVAAGAALLWGLWAAETLSLPVRIAGAITLLLALWWAPLWLRGVLLLLPLALYALQKLSFRAALSAVGLLLLPLRESWGSFPFLYLWEVRNDVPAGTVPLDGNGLNPLLQSFWMVIHPPILFAGYAAAALPFWEALRIAHSGTLSIIDSRRLLRFLWLAVTLLGLGIALGAYWAYETLNFGGYWNWDPVENASFAPWLVLVAAAHLLWVWRRQRKNANLALALSALAFPLVLYSSYLTRSGVLSDSSVHSFTDLGLGSWLLWGVGLSTLGSAVAFLRWPPRALLLRGALFAGSSLLTLTALLLLLLTSLPALNKLFGTAWALGSNALQVYYEWMGVLAAPLLVLMGYALLQAYRARGWELVAWLSGALLIGIVAILWWAGWDFVYHPTYRSLLSGGLLDRLRAGFFLLLDDMLWGASLISLGAVVALLLQRRSRAVWGAALAHAGFALLLIGAILSSGYERTLSQNFNPRSPGGGDNLFLPLGGEAFAVGYKVTYTGLLTPKPPLRDLRPLLQSGGQTLWRFVDSLGYAYQVWLPEGLFPSSPIQPVALSGLHAILEQNLALLPVEPADRRYRYQVTLTHLESQKTYPLLLEADLSESSGLLAHPSHIRLWHGDLYVHLTSLPKLDGDPLLYTDLALGLRDTATWGELTLTFEKLTEVEGAPHPTFRAWLAAWKGLPQLAQRIPVEFAIQDSQLLTPTASLPALGLSAQVEGFSVQEKKLRFRLALRQQPDSFITLKILYKPFIGLFWGGIVLLLIGTGWAFVRHW